MKLHYAIIANVPEDKELAAKTPPIGSIVGVPDHVWPRYEGTKVFIELTNEVQRISSLDYPALYQVVGDTWGPTMTLLNAACKMHTLFNIPPFRDPFREMFESRLFMQGVGVEDVSLGGQRPDHIVH